jgi:hypothetical protein
MPVKLVLGQSTVELTLCCPNIASGDSSTDGREQGAGKLPDLDAANLVTLAIWRVYPYLINLGINGGSDPKKPAPRH